MVSVHPIRHSDVILTLLQFEYFPLSMSYGQNQLWVGDKMGSLHLVDATNGLFDLVEVRKLSNINCRVL